ncbi:MAG: hypothetical protein WCI94_12625 [Rhodospirillales bacterium]
MKDSDLTKLRSARARVHRVLDRLEPMIAGYREKLDRLNAEIQALAPELNLPPRRYQPNPHFARGELPRIAMRIFREAGGPIAVRDIAVRALALKGVPLPDRQTMKITRTRLQQMFIVWEKRGILTSVGENKRRKRVLVGEV